jgi:hypothetical protein
MEITMGNKTYPLKASFAFLKEIEKSYTAVEKGVKVEYGLAYHVNMLQERGDLRSLALILYLLGTGQKPRLEMNTVEAYLEDECEDIEGLIAEVIDFLSKANVCKTQFKKFNLLPETKA